MARTMSNKEVLDYMINSRECIPCYRGVNRRGNEWKPSSWHHDGGWYEKVEYPLVEIDREFDPGRELILGRCASETCRQNILMEIVDGPVLPRLDRHSDVELNRYAFIKSSPGINYEEYAMWIGQCKKCRTIYWRVQETHGTNP